MCDQGFRKVDMYRCCYFKDFGDSYILFALVYGCMLIASVSKRKIITLKYELAKEFKKDLGLANQILGMHISRKQAADIFTLS